MKEFKLYDRKSIEKFISYRKGETKLGERIQFISAPADLSESDAEFVIFGIPEDIGVRANHGKPGTATAWNAFLSAFLNVQVNKYLDQKKILLLGEIDIAEAMRKAGNIDTSDPNYHQKLGDLVGALDEVVAEVVSNIVSSEKVPVIIGGGHNNAFGNLKGTSKAMGKPVNVINIDAHTDLRNTDYRHSGNGFSYARKNGFLGRYAIFGLHENYTPQYIFEEMNASEAICYSLLEELPNDHSAEFQMNLDFVKNDNFGLEVDCDSIQNFPSSAISPSGLSLNEVRYLISTAAKEKNCTYLHVCEAVDDDDYPVGKALSYMVSDFIKNFA